jgi:DNA invertase Pin-like site-specific DNA recombinase
VLIAYARVSTQEQNLRLQLDALNAAGCERLYTEMASGAQRNRPELKAALDYAREGDTLVVWKLDRLARSLKQLIETVEGLEQRKVGFRSLTEAIDTTTPAGRMMMQMVGAFAEFERAMARERTRAGLASAAAQGRKGGRRPKLNTEQRKLVARLVLGGEKTGSEAARLFGVDPATVSRIVSSARSGNLPGAAPTKA